jgi:hypothetical protein
MNLMEFLWVDGCGKLEGKWRKIEGNFRGRRDSEKGQQRRKAAR